MAWSADYNSHRLHRKEQENSLTRPQISQARTETEGQTETYGASRNNNSKIKSNEKSAKPTALKRINDDFT